MILRYQNDKKDHNGPSFFLAGGYNEFRKQRNIPWNTAKKN